MTEEQKNQSMKLSLSNLIDQMEPRVETTEDRRNIDRLKHLLPLYDKHAFWDSQPVPKNLNATTAVNKYLGKSYCIGKREGRRDIACAGKGCATGCILIAEWFRVGHFGPFK